MDDCSDLIVGMMIGDGGGTVWMVRFGGGTAGTTVGVTVGNTGTVGTVVVGTVAAEVVGMEDVKCCTRSGV